MIPKIIHYCWFGGNPKSKLAKKCIKSWKKYCPDYEIIEWNEENYDISSAPLYVRQAYETKKWAFVTDYVRLDVVYKNGGVYFDTDVEVIKSINDLLLKDAFFGFENQTQIATGLGFGAIQGIQLLKDIMNDYYNIPFILEDGNYDSTPCPTRNKTAFAKNGFTLNNELQIIDNIAVFPTEYFCPLELGSHHPKCTKNTYTIHWFSGSWATAQMKKKFHKEYLEIARHNLIHKITRLPNWIMKRILGEETYTNLKNKVK